MGDDLGGIAFRFGVSLDQLITANPKINPSVLIVGNVLIIPPSAKPNPTAQAAAPVVTPVPVDLSQPVCYSDQEKNLTCFSLAHNSLQNSLENIVVDFRRIDTDSGSIFTQRAYAPLDQVLPGANLPLMVVFPSPIPSHFATSVELVTSLPSPQDDTRYLPIQLSNQKTIITSDRLSAQVNGQMQLKNGEKSARRVWLLATAYGSGQQVVGFYRWQLSGTLATGQNQTYQFSVYSVGPGIDHVDLIAEALP
jgi:hypothetical protein